jgi:hypothetical protein
MMIKSELTSLEAVMMIKSELTSLEAAVDLNMRLIVIPRVPESNQQRAPSE